MAKRREIRFGAAVGAIALVMGLSVVGEAAASPPANAQAGDYIVVLHESVQDPGAVAREHARAQGAQVRFVYEHALEGYAATLSEQGLRGVQRDPRVAYVERDGVASIVHHACGHTRPTEYTGECPEEPPTDPDPEEPPPEEDPPPGDCAVVQETPWGIEQVGAHDSSTKAGDCSGAISDVDIYVLDTGVDASHADLNVVEHVNFAGGPNKDCNGHGTHVAGTMAARDNDRDVVGVAPGAPVTGVKVLGCSGSGSWSGVLAGIDFVTENAKGPAVANMSLSGGANSTVDDAVRASAASGIVYSLAAGNSNADACNSSPARAGAGAANGIITVGATDAQDEKASWSNHGSCVDIWAPGVSILSTKSGGGTTTMSGTSMAAPHVGGGAALYLATHNGSGATAVEGALTGAARTVGSLSLLNVSGF